MKIKAGRPAVIGKRAEDIACKYLSQNGINLLERNYSCRFGEIDIIGLDVEILVFIEVRYRSDQERIAAIETIDHRKCKRLLTTSQHYLNHHKKYQSYQYRYDVIVITGMLDEPLVEWIKNAFQA
mgnify:CR=1 FL=1